MKEVKSALYCKSLTEYKRYPTREVFIGDMPLGAANPIRVQSMTTTDTMDTIATVEQTIRMVDSGCEYVRITAPSINEAKNLRLIKEELKKRGCEVPLIADIHFTPNAAEEAARIVEKVRVNPGNYIDKKKFETIEYTDIEYLAEVERIRERFTPLVKICKEYGTAMRIGTNHGSLSDRIMSRFGDSPLGMVESALEFVRICRDENYHSIVLSMKSSNPKVMIQAYRLLIMKMEEEGMNYPLHLGVTEAGGGEDGRIKSALGIGALLEDGIGDTIRVSLTEDPEFEVPVGFKLVNRYKSRTVNKTIPVIEELPYNPLEYKKRNTFEVLGTGGSNAARVIVDYSNKELTTPSVLSELGFFYDKLTDKWNMNDSSPDFIYLGNSGPAFELPVNLIAIYDWEYFRNHKPDGYPLLSAGEFLSIGLFNTPHFIKASFEDMNESFNEALKNNKNSIIVLETNNSHGMAEQREVFCNLMNSLTENPIIIKREYNKLNAEELMLYSSTDIGSLLADGFGDGIWIKADNINRNPVAAYTRNLLVERESTAKFLNRLSFGILQAARVRISKTEYIACPSCGRTLFDLQTTVDMIRKRTEHLKGVKIAVMGCIVNGPGEMADADYGYVGSGVGKITLYKGKDVVRRSIPAKEAVDSLIEIIKEDGNWREPLINDLN